MWISNSATLERIVTEIGHVCPESFGKIDLGDWVGQYLGLVAVPVRNEDEAKQANSSALGKAHQV